MGARAISVLTAVAVVPLALGYLGTERYRIWLTLTSFLALLGFMDLGLGNAVMTTVARTGSGDDRQTATRYVSTGFFLLIGVAVAGAIVWLVVNQLVNWANVLDVESAAATEVAPTVMILIGILLVNLPLGSLERRNGGFSAATSAAHGRQPALLWVCSACSSQSGWQQAFHGWR